MATLTVEMVKLGTQNLLAGIMTLREFRQIYYNQHHILYDNEINWKEELQ